MTGRTGRRHPSPGGPARAIVPALVAAVTLASGAGSASAQLPPPDELILVERGVRVSLGVNFDRGFRAFPVERLESAGWTVDETRTGARLEAPDGTEVSFDVGSAFFMWDAQIFHLTDPPYRFERRVWVPVQLLIDFLPREMPARYALDPATGGLLVRTPAPGTEESEEEIDPAIAEILRDRAPADRDEPVIPARGARPVVVIDAGHGGRDEGTVGPNETAEKEVVLAVALATASELRRRDTYDVFVTRADDSFIPLWERGEMATDWRDGAPGAFISLHANSAPDDEASGVETFFLAEARTDHASRLAAIENAVRVRDFEGRDVDPDGGLGPLLTDLRNEDLQRWSAHLAGLLQREVSEEHPGRGRGVKQGPFAVLTNTMMPSALLELGFLSNPEDEGLLTDRAYQRRVAVAIADAIDRFFRGYPPGGGGA